MADAGKLLSCLEHYSGALERHGALLRERHADLEMAWRRLMDVYEGEAAELFAEAFASASARLAGYEDGVAAVTKSLAEKREELRRFQASEAEL